MQIAPDSAGANFNLGCALARKNDVEGAVQSLAKAIELNPVLREEAKTDEDFHFIRGDPAFRKLVYGE